MEKTVRFLDTVDVELFRLYIHNLRWTAGAIAHFADVVKNYGNKVYNVRFDKLLQAELDKYVESNPVELDKWRAVKPYVSVRGMVPDFFADSKIFDRRDAEQNFYFCQSAPAVALDPPASARQ